MDLIKYDMTDIWASAGDVVAPDSAKINAGWGVEVVPRQWWNWFENRQDQNIAYMLQKGFPEWDSTTEYIINKSYVQRNGVVYKATATSTNSDPASLTSWVRAFVDYTAAGNALGSLTPDADRLPYFTGSTTAAVTTFTAFARTLLDDVDDLAARTTLGAQAASTNLTALSGVAAGVNVLPYFNSTTTMLGTTLTAYARSLLDDVDATAARTTLEVPSTAYVDGALATKQPLDATLTGLAGVTTAANTLIYATGADTFTTTALTPFARTLIDDNTAAESRTTLDVPSTSDLSSGLAGRQPLNSYLTSLSGVTLANDRLVYSTGTSSVAATTLTSFARSILDDVDAPAVRATINAADATATQAALDGKQPLNVNLTALSSIAAAADRLPYFNGASTMANTTLTAYARTLLDDVDAATARSTLGLGTAATATLTTSTADTTVGRVTRVGDYQIGTTAMAANIVNFLAPPPTGAVKGVFSTVTNGPNTSAVGFTGWCTKYDTSVAMYLIVDSAGNAYKGVMSSSSVITWETLLSSGMLTTGPLDSTAGRITRVGDFGIGTLGLSITTANVDSASTLRSGTYRFDVTGSPWRGLPVGVYNLFVGSPGSSTLSFQLVTSFTTGLIYSRINTGSDFTPVSSDAAGRVLQVSDIKTSGVPGGTATAGAWRVRDLNTVDSNNIPGASLASNRVTLPAGTYDITAVSTVFGVLDYRHRLADISTGNTLLDSTTGGWIGTSILCDTTRTMVGRISLPVATTMEFQTWVTSTRATDGFGRAVSIGSNEKYTTLQIRTV